MRTKTLFCSMTVGLGLAGPLAAEVPNVVTDIAPVHSLVAQVMGGLGDPALVVEPGVSPHGFSLKPSQARALQNADLVIWMGESLTPWMEKPVATLAEGAKTIELLETDGTTRLDYRDVHEDDHGDDNDDHDDHGDEHEEHDDHADEHDEEHEEAHAHDHDGVDPHAWLDPDNASVWLSAIAEQLAELDPDNAAAYRANAAKGQAEVAALSARIEERLTGYSGAPFIAFHDAFQYFEKRFGLKLAGTVSLSDASDPSPARLAELRDRIGQFGVTCAFTEPQLNHDVLTAVAEGSSVRISVLDPLGASLEPGANLYVAMMSNLSEAVLGCLDQ